MLRKYLAVSSDYHDQRSQWWSENAALWAKYVDEDKNRPLVFERVIETAQAAHVAGLETSAFLDIGAGEGMFVRWVAKRFPRATVVGIDFCGRMVDLAKARAPSASTSFVFADIEDPVLSRSDFASRSFDIVTAILTFVEIGRIDAAFANIAQVLHKDGVLVLVVLDAATELLRYTSSSPSKTLLAERDLVHLRHFHVGNEESPTWYPRILRCDFEYCAEAEKHGLRLVDLRRLRGHLTEGHSTMPPEFTLLAFAKPSIGRST